MIVRPSSSMKTCIAAGSLLAASLLASAASADQLTVDITEIKEIGGSMMVAVYNTAEAWNGGPPVASTRDSVTGETVRVIFANLEAGDYAVMLFHDANSNGELDSNMLGIPSEGYGFSNNVGRFGKPDFEEAMFTVTGETAIEINLR